MQLTKAYIWGQNVLQSIAIEIGMKVIRHAGVDSGMIILGDQARQQMTLHFQFSLQCNISPITCLIMPDEARDGQNAALKWQLEVKSHLLACLIVQNNHPTMLLRLIDSATYVYAHQDLFASCHNIAMSLYATPSTLYHLHSTVSD